ncbi:lysozyme [Edaphobacter albus]|uniref:lysozyme n=1 Tax=Edaphobacter sp. 4G125 TaxID=2763071 RepID=UPI0016444AB0|nr:lysozyme [Edaphobacter sp. 4G125]QNI36925.1 lysozyme [Edaphobacter sp. 4G125]
MANLTYSDAGLALTKQFEGCSLEAYQDQAGVWTIGYGHTGQVKPGTACSQTQADAWRREDIAKAETCVHHLIKIPLTQGQFDALVDFVFNLGCSNLAGSTLLRCVNARQFEQAALEFLRWNHVGGVEVKGLTRRRKAEAERFQSSTLTS